MSLTSKELADITGASFRQIDHWCRIGLIDPIGNARPGSGSYRQFNENIIEKTKFLVNISKIFDDRFYQTTLKEILKEYERGLFDLGNDITLTWKVE